MTAIGLFVDARRLEDSGRSAASHLSHTLELLTGAEQLGCQSVWFTEHHDFPDGYLPQPLILAAAVAARTTRMRLGTAVLLAGLRHPRHIAEEAALVDLLSAGRFELGLGAGYAQSEYDAFGVDMARRFDRTDATALEVQRLLSSVTPGPVQKPLPLWLGYQGPKGATRAGRCGMGLLSLDPALVDPYRIGLEAAGFSWSDARMGGLVDIIVADDPPRALERILPHWLHQQNTYRALRRQPDGSPLAPLGLERARVSMEKSGRLGTLQVLDVDAAAAELSTRTKGLPAEHAYTWLSVADMPDDVTERHVELWCGPVRRAVEASLTGHN